MYRGAILDDYQGIALGLAPWDKLAGRVEVVAFSDHLDDRDAIAARLMPFDVVVAMRERTPFDRSLIERLPNLKLLVTTGARNASIDVAAAKDHGVVVCGTGSKGPPTAELTFALLLALARHIPTEAAAVRDKGWQVSVGIDLAGAQIGLIGLGRLGARVAAMAKAFEMRVKAWSPHLTEARCNEVGVDYAGSLDALMRTSDVVSIHLVLAPSTRGLIGAPELALMKPSAILINTSRGPIVDEAALIATLRERRIAAAGLDVFDVEPLPADHFLRTADNVLATPHIGYVTEGTYAVFYGDALEDIDAWLAGAPIRVIER